jgi:hypothetical protein
VISFEFPLFNGRRGRTPTESFAKDVPKDAMRRSDLPRCNAVFFGSAVMHGAKEITAPLTVIASGGGSYDSFWGIFIRQRASPNGSRYGQ